MIAIWYNTEHGYSRIEFVTLRQRQKALIYWQNEKCYIETYGMNILSDGQEMKGTGYL
ncbi:MAG: hypothetical protein ACI9J4_000353 [Paraglaciecola sp.]|jgi:hypothetical protein